MSDYTIIKIPKRNGKVRTIYSPGKELKARCLDALKRVTDTALRCDEKLGVMRGFLPGENPVTNALSHVGWRYTLKMDLSDFFDSVTVPKVVAGVADGQMVAARKLEIANDASNIMIDHVARQGLPTSPALANIAAHPIDRDIMKLQVRHRGIVNFVYTRYADDLCFSFNHLSFRDTLLAEVPKIVEQWGFKINPAKTKLQCQANGRREITGVALTNDGRVVPPRWQKRRLRAMKHQLKKGFTKKGVAILCAKRDESHRRNGYERSLYAVAVAQAQGLEGWLQMKTPKVQRARPNRPAGSLARSVAAVAASTKTAVHKLGYAIRRMIP